MFLRILIGPSGTTFQKTPKEFPKKNDEKISNWLQKTKEIDKRIRKKN